MNEVHNYPDIYMSPKGKQMVKNTRVTLEGDSALIEVERREVTKAMVAKFIHGRLSYKQREEIQHA